MKGVQTVHTITRCCETGNLLFHFLFETNPSQRRQTGDCLALLGLLKHRESQTFHMALMAKKASLMQGVRLLLVFC